MSFSPKVKVEYPGKKYAIKPNTQIDGALLALDRRSLTE